MEILLEQTEKAATTTGAVTLGGFRVSVLGDTQVPAWQVPKQSAPTLKYESALPGGWIR